MLRSLALCDLEIGPAGVSLLGRASSHWDFPVAGVSPFPDSDTPLAVRNPCYQGRVLCMVGQPDLRFEEGGGALLHPTGRSVPGEDPVPESPPCGRVSPPAWRLCTEPWLAQG